MKKIFFLFCLFFATLSFSQKQIPDITISDFEGNNEKVHNLLSHDKLTVISLWATWCVPCIKELDAINEVYDDWKEENLKIIITRMHGWQLETFKESYNHKKNKGISLFKKNLLENK